MDGVGVDSSRRKSFKDRLGRFNSMAGCCGSTWGRTAHDNDDNHDCEAEDPNPPVPIPDITPPDSGMNLAAALAAERLFRSTQEMIEEDGSSGVGHTSTPVGTPARVSLMRLLEESDGGDGEMGSDNDCVCCVCMGRKKGSAFIPCGHTFCRVCTRELWLNRGSCPLCNRSILEILDIF